MKKKIGSILLSLSIAAFSACNSSSNNSSTAAKDSAATKDTINSNYNPATPAAQNGQ